MNIAYWDQIWKIDHNSVFDVFKNDKNKVISSWIKDLASKNSTAIDFGCGIGRGLPLLAKKFKHVYAVDCSENCLNSAKKACFRFRNVSFRKVDLSKNSKSLPKCDIGLSVNLVIMPGFRQRVKILKALSNKIKTGGYLILVLPSMESFFYSTFRLIDWNLKVGYSFSQAKIIGFKKGLFIEKELIDGVVRIEGTQTKHFLKEELQLLMKKINFKIVSLEKVEYSWKTEFNEPPKWMKDPYPWDWLVVSRKI